MPKEKPNLTQEEILWKIYESSEKTRKYLMWNRILSFIKILIIIIPIILAIIYLPPLIQNAISPYQELLGEVQTGKNAVQNLNLNDLIQQYTQ